MKPLEEKLKSVKSAGSPPPGLHDSIVSAVRAATETRAPRAASGLPRWFWVAGAAALILFAAWMMRVMPVATRGPAPSLAAAEPALTAAHKLAREVPAAMMSPMTEELAAVDRDVRKAVEHLVASVP